MGPTEIDKDGSFYRTQRSSALAVLKLPPLPPPTKKKKEKNQFYHCQTVWLFQWFTYGHSCITANTLQDSDSHENHNELYIYNYALAKFLLANRVNVFAIYLVVIA